MKFTFVGLFSLVVSICSANTESEVIYPILRDDVPKYITFRNGFGTIISNATIVKVRVGIELEWRDYVGSGTVKLSDLPQDLQEVFGYNPIKSEIFEQIASSNRAIIALQQRNYQKVLDYAASLNVKPVSEEMKSIRASFATYHQKVYGGWENSYSGNSYRGYSSGTVNVRSYFRKDGTYVRAHQRQRPRR